MDVDTFDRNLQVHILSYIKSKGWTHSAHAFEQETSINNVHAIQDCERFLEACWGTWADHYVPVPKDVSCPQELEAFYHYGNGEWTLGTLRTIRFIVKYMKMKSFQQSADRFFEETRVIEKPGDGDRLLEDFWIPCMTEKKAISVSPNTSLVDTNLFIPPPTSMPRSSGGSSDFLIKFLMTVRKQQQSFKFCRCHFSTDGKYLAFAGTNRVVTVWDVETQDHVGTTSELQHMISDIRFQPRSNLFAASCYDTFIHCWHLSDVSKSTHKLEGHTCAVLSVDFSQKNPSILCSGDKEGEVRIWDLRHHQIIFKFKESGVDVKQIRFAANDLIALVVGNNILIKHLEIDGNATTFIKKDHLLEGHDGVKSVCWDTTGVNIASVSRGCAHVWTVTDGDWKSDYKLEYGGEPPFETCLFHPSFPQLLILGSYSNIHLWEYLCDKTQIVTMPNPTLITSLAGSPGTGLIASTSGEVTLWK